MSETAAATTGETGNPPDADKSTDTKTSTALDGLPDEFGWVRDELTKVRNEAAKYRTRAREFASDDDYEAAKAAVAKLREIEESNKTDLQKANEAKQAAEETARKATRQLAKSNAARTHGLPDDAIEFLTGDTDEEIEACAKRFAELMAAKAPQRRPDYSQGSTAGATASASTADKFAAVVDPWLS